MLSRQKATSKYLYQPHKINSGFYMSAHLVADIESNIRAPVLFRILALVPSLFNKFIKT